MSSTGYKKPFKVNKIAIDFFLGAGLSACWSFYSGNDANLVLVSVSAAICGVAAIILIEGYRYINKRMKNGGKKQKVSRRSSKSGSKVSW